MRRFRPIVTKHGGFSQAHLESVSHHRDVLGKRLVLSSTDRESHFLPWFENVVVYNVGQNEGDLGAVRAINNSKPLRVHFFDDSHHFVGFSPRRLLSFSIAFGRAGELHRLNSEQLHI